MNLKASFAAAVLGLVVAGAACSSADTPAPAAGVVTQSTVADSSTTSSSTTSSSAAFDAQAYCVQRLGELAVKYPKSLGGADLQAECRKMLDKTAATSAKTIDALLEASETYYKAFG